RLCDHRAVPGAAAGATRPQRRRSRRRRGGKTLSLTSTMQHWVVAPVLLPLATAALMILLGGSRRRVKAVINISSTLAGLILAAGLLVWVDDREAGAAFGIYLPGNWTTPFGIVLVLDRLSALMAVLAGSLAFAALLY